MSKPDVTPERIMQFFFGYAPTLVLGTAIKHGILDVLDKGPKSAAEVAEEAQTSARGTRMVLDVLVSLEFVSKDKTGRYALLPEAATFLVRGKPPYLGGFFKHVSQHILPNWMQLDQVVKTGKPAVAGNVESTGTKFFEEFVEDHFPLSYPCAQLLAAALGVPAAKAPVSILDIAAGSGVWGIGIAQTSPHVTVTAVDWEGVLPVTRRMVGRFGLTERFRFIPGDLQTADFGKNHRAATLGHILHSEGEERSRKLLKRVFDALAPGGTISIAEFLVNAERTGPVGGTIFAVNMLVNTEKGDTFSFEEISGWLKEAGFVNARLLDCPGPSPLVLADKPGV